MKKFRIIKVSPPTYAPYYYIEELIFWRFWRKLKTRKWKNMRGSYKVLKVFDTAENAEAFITRQYTKVAEKAVKVIII